MENFQRLQVADIRRETPSAASVAFRVPDELKKDYEFKAGQYLTLRTMLDGEDVRRSYSVCVSPHEDELRVAVKHLQGGLFSSYVTTQLKEGDYLDVSPAEGSFTHDFDKDDKGNYVAFAAGSGITPVISLLKTALETKPDSQFTLFYGNSRSVDIIFLDQLASLKDEFTTRLSVFHILTREEGEFPILSGRLDRQKLDELIDNFVPFPEKVDRYFMCGPEQMMDSAEAILKGKNIGADKICIERFGTSLTEEEQQAFAKRAEQATGTMMEIIHDGRKVQVPFNAEAGNILDAARSAGLPAPFSCKGGVCATCRAKIIEGEVEMAVHYGLSDDEIKRGHILTCQAVPTSDKISISFDV